MQKLDVSDISGYVLRRRLVDTDRYGRGEACSPILDRKRDLDISNEIEVLAEPIIDTFAKNTIVLPV